MCGIARAVPTAQETAHPPPGRVSSLFWLGVCLYLGVAVTVGRFPQTDETFYKAAGREWAASGRFSAPELEGGSGVQPPLQEVFAVYPPLYPFVFGLFVRLVGFSWRACVAYDALIHAALTWATYQLASRLLPAKRGYLPCAVALALLPLGTSARPDELGMVFALLALERLARPNALANLSGPMAAGVLLGLAGATSPGVVVLLGFGAACAVLTSPVGVSRSLLQLFVVAGAMVVVIGLAFSLLWASHAEAHRQFFQQEAWRHLGRAPVAAYRLWLPYWPTLVLVAAALLVGMLDIRTRGFSGWARSWLAPGLGVLAVLLLLPGKHTYLWFWGPWLLVASVATLMRMTDRHTALATTAGALLLAALALAAAQPLRQGVILLLLPETQTPMASLRRLQTALPRDGVVLVDEFWGLLAGDFAVRDAWWSRPKLEAIDAVVLSGNGTGAPGTPRRLPEPLASYVRGNFEVVRNDLNDRPPRILGLALSRSGYGFGALVLRRRASAPSGTGTAGP